MYGGGGSPYAPLTRPAGWGTLSSSATEAGDGSSAKEACVRSAYVEETAGARVEKVKHAATKGLHHFETLCIS